jgi:hypothetical protein
MRWPTSGASSADMQSNRHTWNERKKYELLTYLLNQDFEYILFVLFKLVFDSFVNLTILPVQFYGSTGRPRYMRVLYSNL